MPIYYEMNGLFEEWMEICPPAPYNHRLKIKIKSLKRIEELRRTIDAYKKEHLKWCYIPFIPKKELENRKAHVDALYKAIEEGKSMVEPI